MPWGETDPGRLQVGPFILLTMIVVAMTAEHWWTARRIRHYYAALDATVLRIRWLPLAPLQTLQFRNLTALYRVWYRDRQGQTWSTRFVCGLWDGFYPLDAERIAAPHVNDTQQAGLATPLSPWTIGTPEWPSLLAASVGAVAGCCAIGATYWPPPLKDMNLPDGLYGLGLIAVGLIAAGLTWWRPQQWLWIAGILALSPVAAIAVRVARDLAVDPGSHNLLGIEIIIGIIVGAVVAGGGVLGARLVSGLLALPQRPPSSS